MSKLITAVAATNPLGNALLLCLGPRDRIRETRPQAVGNRVVDTFALTVSGERVKVYAASSGVADQLTAIAESFEDGTVAEAGVTVTQVESEDGHRTFATYRTIAQSAEVAMPEDRKAA